MGKETIKKHKGRMILENTLGKFERMNSEELRILADRTVYGLAPIRVLTRHRGDCAYVDITTYTPLSIYMQERMAVETVLSFLWHTVRIAHECECYGLRIDHLCWDPSRIYVDANGVVTMIYWPITSLETNQHAAWQFYCTLGSLLFESGISSGIYSRYYQFFNKRTALDMNALYYLVQDLMREWKEKKTKEDRNRDMRRERENIESVRKNRLALAVSPWLEFEQTREKIVLKKDKILFGRGKQCDIDLTGHDGVSRSHAMVFKKENRYYIMDVGSRNGTFVNGMRLPSNGRVVLQNGMTVQIGSVVLCFHEMQNTQTVFIHRAKER